MWSNKSEYNNVCVLAMAISSQKNLIPFAIAANRFLSDVDFLGYFKEIIHQHLFILLILFLKFYFSKFYALEIYAVYMNWISLSILYFNSKMVWNDWFNLSVCRCLAMQFLCDFSWAIFRYSFSCRVV